MSRDEFLEEVINFYDNIKEFRNRTDELELKMKSSDSNVIRELSQHLELEFQEQLGYLQYNLTTTNNAILGLLWHLTVHESLSDPYGNGYTCGICKKEFEGGDPHLDLVEHILEDHREELNKELKIDTGENDG